MLMAGFESLTGEIMAGKIRDLFIFLGYYDEGQHSNSYSYSFKVCPMAYRLNSLHWLKMIRIGAILDHHEFLSILHGRK